MDNRSGCNLHRVLLYSHDTYGLGHLRRNLAIANHLLRKVPMLQVVLLTGSPSAERFVAPRGLSLVRLPPVVKVGAEEYHSRNPRFDFGLVRRARAAIIADVARRFEPNVFLIDHAPLGMKGELSPAFACLRRFSPDTRMILGLRDIIDEPASVRHAWACTGVMETLERVYDRIAVYGSREMFDVAEAYGFSASVRARTAYTGYLWRTPQQFPPDQYSDLPSSPFVLGTAGGGGDGLNVLRATLRASEAIGVASLLVTGLLMDPCERHLLQEEVQASRRGRLLEFHPRLEAIMNAATAVVTMGGYNSLCEIVPTGVPAIVVPRAWPRREQAIRAEIFAAKGLVKMVAAGPALERRLREALSESLSSTRRQAPNCAVSGFERLRQILLAESEGNSERRQDRATFDPSLHSEVLTR